MTPLHKTRIYAYKRIGMLWFCGFL